jgi:hypothetical protein
VIYFIRNQTSKAIKIGYTAGDAKMRLRQLQTGHSDRLELLGTIEGGMGLERDLHKKLKFHRIVGEWFHPHDEVESTVRKLLAPEREFPDAWNIEYLSKISKLVCMVPMAEKDLPNEIPLLEPLQEISDHMEFDRSVCAAGIKAFMRKTMLSDYPNCETFIDPETKETVKVSDMDLGTYMVVFELSKGIRGKHGLVFKNTQ